ncbi:hypothetical protein ABT160_04475 [Streptomyces sp. NPDC001941]|uniref:hypothetical protein n=1 Tax=Streptomyces sp. NPDC001941 TaxID=3154659 RepID=UPI00331C5E10
MTVDILLEYRGLAGRQVGVGTIHEVAAFWDARDDLSERAIGGRGKRVLLNQGRVVDHAKYVGLELDTYNSPRLAAILRYRLLTAAEVDRQAKLSRRVHKSCDECKSAHPGQVVRMQDSEEERALCFGCWNPIQEHCKVLHWINRHGKLQLWA